MTANELLCSIDGKVRLDIKSGMSAMIIKGGSGGGSIAETVKSLPALDSEMILNAPARIRDPIEGFTDVVIDMDEVKKELKRRKEKK